MNNRLIGWSIVLIYGLLLAYYATWTVIIPFVDEGHQLRLFFPDLYYAVAAPILFAYTIFCFTFAFIGILLIRSNTGDKIKSE